MCISACMHTCVLHARLVLMEVRRGCCMPWSWSYGRYVWVLKTEPRSSAGATNALNRRANFPAPETLTSEFVNSKGN